MFAALRDCILLTALLLAFSPALCGPRNDDVEVIPLIAVDF